LATGQSRAIGVVLAGLLLVVFAIAAWPKIEPGWIPGPRPDAEEYAHLASALLHGTYLIDYPSGAVQPSRYSPGFPIMLAPSVAIGGLEAAVWTSYLAALALGTLAAIIAARLGGGVAAPLAVVLTIFTPAVVSLSAVVMSDVPFAAVGLGQLALLALASGQRSAASAGVLAAVLVWMRPAALTLIIASLMALWGARCALRRAAAFVVGLLPLLLALAAWQRVAYGSPLTTSYQAFNESVGAGSGLGNFFSLGYAFGPPWNAYLAGTTPNAVVYGTSLLGVDSAGAWFGVGVIGLLGASFMARSAAEVGIVGRFTLAVSAVTLLVYVPYFFQDQRFLLFPEVLNNVVASVVIAKGIAAARTRLPSKWRPQPFLNLFSD